MSFKFTVTYPNSEIELFDYFIFKFPSEQAALEHLKNQNPKINDKCIIEVVEQGNN